MENCNMEYLVNPLETESTFTDCYDFSGTCFCKPQMCSSFCWSKACRQEGPA